MPEWFVQGAFGVLLSIIGYMVMRIDKKLDRIEDRQTKVEKDCVTWIELEKTNLKVGEIDRRTTVIETTCKTHLQIKQV